MRRISRPWCRPKPIIPPERRDDHHVKNVVQIAAKSAVLFGRNAVLLGRSVQTKGNVGPKLPKTAAKAVSPDVSKDPLVQGRVLGSIRAKSNRVRASDPSRKRVESPGARDVLRVSVPSKGNGLNKGNVPKANGPNKASVLSKANALNKASVHENLNKANVGLNKANAGLSKANDLNRENGPSVRLKESVRRKANVRVVANLESLAHLSFVRQPKNGS
jgi:hypothetical protein